jgi:hypothetical protein
MIFWRSYFPALGALVAAIALSGCVASSRQQSTEITTSPRETMCSRVRTAALLGGSRSGSFGEEFANSEAAYANCMAGLPLSLPREPRTLSCTPDRMSLNNSITCTEL